NDRLGRHTQGQSTLTSNLSHKIHGRCKISARRPYRLQWLLYFVPAKEPEREPMPSPRLLVIEGNSPQTTAEHVAAGGAPASQGYSGLLREVLARGVVRFFSRGGRV